MHVSLVHERRRPRAVFLTGRRARGYHREHLLKSHLALRTLPHMHLEW